MGGSRCAGFRLSGRTPEVAVGTSCPIGPFRRELVHAEKAGPRGDAASEEGAGPRRHPGSGRLCELTEAVCCFWPPSSPSKREVKPSVQGRATVGEDASDVSTDGRSRWAFQHRDCFAHHGRVQGGPLTPFGVPGPASAPASETRLLPSPPRRGGQVTRPGRTASQSPVGERSGDRARAVSPQAAQAAPRAEAQRGLGPPRRVPPRTRPNSAGGRLAHDSLRTLFLRGGNQPHTRSRSGWSKGMESTECFHVWTEACEPPGRLLHRRLLRSAGPGHGLRTRVCDTPPVRPTAVR